MSTRSLCFLALLLASTVPGCHRPGAESGDPAAQAAGDGPPAKGEPTPAQGGEEGLVRIAPEMLRDLKLTLAKAEARPAGQRVSVLGEVKIDESSYAAVSTPIAARVMALRAEPGQRVRAGQTLAELQSVELGRARAAEESAAARAGLAEQTLERKRGLAAERIVSRGELQQAEAAAAEARAELRAARAALAALGVPLGQTGGEASRFALLSPLGGTVLERKALRGETADPSQPIFRIADLSRLWVVAQASERDAMRVREGAPVEIDLAALPGRAFRGTVARVGREVSSESRTVPVRIDLPNPEGVLRPGMSATVQLPLADSAGRVVTVPTNALQRLDEGWCVFLPRAQGVFEARPVGRGRDLSGEVEILSGLRAGTTVVVDGAFLLKAEADKAHGGGHDHD
jgi:cobalt-zinc-cadmium efflux system membrane fusion protein